MTTATSADAASDAVKEALTLTGNNNADDEEDIDGFGDFAIDSDEENNDIDDDDIPANPFASDSALASVDVDLNSPAKTGTEEEGSSGFEHPLAEGVLAAPSPAVPPTATTTTTAAAAPTTVSTGSGVQLFKNTLSSKLTSFATKAAATAQATAQAITSETMNITNPHSNHPPPSTTPPPNQNQNAQQPQSQVEEMDNALKSKLITSAIGPLLPGERVIMFLSHLPTVRDSSSPHTLVDPTSLIWCCAMTFYRIVLFSYNDHELHLLQTSSPPSSTINTVQKYIKSSSISRQCQTLHTNYHHSSTGMKHYLIQMPLASIDRIERLNPPSSITTKQYYKYTTASTAAPSTTPSTNSSLRLIGKDNYRRITFSTLHYSDLIRAQEALMTYAFPGRRNLGYLFAFESRRAEVMASSTPQPPTNGTAVPTRKRFDAQREYTRQGLFTPRIIGEQQFLPWAPVNVNASYSLCASYPSFLLTPSKITGQEGLRLLHKVASFRSEHRLPSLTWASNIDGASLWRSAQPKVGLQGNRSTADEMYLRAIAETAHDVTSKCCPTRPSESFLQMLTGNMSGDTDLLLRENSALVTKKNGVIGGGLASHSVGENKPKCWMKILDLRPKSAAMANRTQGYGYENTSYYQHCTINFMGIGNIHAVRDAYQKISNLCLSATANDIQWTQLVEETRWPSMIRLILSASWQTAFHIYFNRLPVLLHCSHGWDRTSQVSALSQIFLDEYYRTKEGFATLIEKDFMSFGHPFHTRGGHGEGRGERGGVPGSVGNTGSSGGSGSNHGGGGTTVGGGGGDEGQLSPIFLQFLDCVYQIVNQYPDYFEFNTKYLLLLSEHVYSCRFGTLLCDTEREREVVAGIRQRTFCLWDYLDSMDELVNVNYVRQQEWRKQSKKGEDDTVYGEDGVLMMPLPTLLRNVTLWTDRHCMYGPKATVRCMPEELEQYCTGLNSGEGSHVVVAKDRAPLLSTNDIVDGELKRAMEEVEKWKNIAKSYLEELDILKAGGVGEKEVVVVDDDDDAVIVNGGENVEERMITKVEEEVSS